MRLVQLGEQPDVHRLIPEFAAEAFYQGVLQWLPRCDVVPISLCLIVQLRIAVLVNSVQLSLTITLSELRWAMV